MKSTAPIVSTETPDQIRARNVGDEISCVNKAIRGTLDEIRTRIGERGKFHAAEHLIYQAWSLMGAAQEILSDAPDIAAKTIERVRANFTDETLKAFGITL